MKIRTAALKDIDKLVDVYSEWSKFKNVLPSDLIQPVKSKKAGKIK